ncbi:hypothetical protein LB467_09905 [Salegentibacter sp. JZCK2]|uniref:hypothetical protein n=1 Tax=Salegentibacter tibetensis TaxID=2873600 RepID=UPI001CCABDAE|nr:hypothetical protein [Salegentibacter tibetensis]MBZ9729999.1 hypothetical protein [Salegentibacter tibetensis]
MRYFNLYEENHIFNISSNANFENTPVFMKYPIYLIFIIAVFLSCSTNDENKSNDINPPDWIQSTWLVEGSTTGNSGVKFTSNDLVLIQGFAETSQRDLINHSRELGQEVVVTENKSNDSYSLRLELAYGQTVNLDFTKISNNEITWNQVANSILIKQ